MFFYHDIDSFHKSLALVGQVYAVWGLSMCLFSCLYLPLSHSLPHTSPPSFPRWPAVNLSLPSSLKDYIEGHPLRSAIRKPGRGTALIGPEIAKETRLDLEGQETEEEG